MECTEARCDVLKKVLLHVHPQQACASIDMGKHTMVGLVIRLLSRSLLLQVFLNKVNERCFAKIACKLELMEPCRRYSYARPQHAAHCCLAYVWQHALMPTAPCHSKSTAVLAH